MAKQITRNDPMTVRFCPEAPKCTNICINISAFLLKMYCTAQINCLIYGDFPIAALGLRRLAVAAVLTVPQEKDSIEETTDQMAGNGRLS